MTLTQYQRLQARIIRVWDSEVLKDLRKDIREELLDSGEYTEDNVDENVDWLFMQCGK
jgi:hypothetical protein